MSNDLKFGLELNWKANAAIGGIGMIRHEWGMFRKLIVETNADLLQTNKLLDSSSAGLRKYAGGFKLGTEHAANMGKAVIGLHQEMSLFDNRLINSRDHLRNWNSGAVEARRGMRGLANETQHTNTSIYALEHQFTSATNATRRLASEGTRNMSALREGASRLSRTLATLGIGAGVGYGTFSVLRGGARLDQELTRTGIAGDASDAEVRKLRRLLFSEARMTGQSVDGLQKGYGDLVQLGLSFDQANPVIRAMNKAQAVTGADSGSLANGLSSASAIFNFDLAKPGTAQLLLDQMTKAGFGGSAELQNLSDILPRVGTNAIQSGFTFPKALGFIESLSKIQHQPEKLATLADSTLRVFTNKDYAMQAQAATGVPFLDKHDNNRDPLDVLTDLRTKFGTYKSDGARGMFLQRAFGKTDQDTLTGIKMLMTPGRIEDARALTKMIEGAAGTLDQNLHRALNNAEAQSGRLKAAMREVADAFATPVNRTLANGINTALQSKKDGGMGLSNGQVLAYGAGGIVAALVAAGAAKKVGSWGAKKLGGIGSIFGGAASTAMGVAEGLALQKATGVNPVFVTNWSGAKDALGGGGLGKDGKPDFTSPIGMLRGMLGVGAAAFAGIEVGTAIYNQINDAKPFTDALDKMLGLKGYDPNAKASKADVGGTIKIELDSRGLPRVTGLEGFNGMDVRANTGPLVVMP